MTSPYLEKRLRSEQEARDDIWRAIENWTKPPKHEREPEGLLCNNCEMRDAVWGGMLCLDCLTEHAEERQREEARDYRGPRYWGGQ